MKHKTAVTLVLALSLAALGALAACTQGEQAGPTAGRAVVTLERSAGTGFEWMSSVSGTAVTVQTLMQDGQEALPEEASADEAAGAGSEDEETIVGGPVQDAYEVTAVSAGTATVTFDLIRPWEADQDPAETCSVTFEVADDLSMTMTGTAPESFADRVVVD